MDTKEIISVKLKQINNERTKSRILRYQIKIPEDTEDDFNPVEMYLENDEIKSPSFQEIETTFFSDPPPPPVFIEDKSAIETLKLLYPIEENKKGEWFIVSPCFYIDSQCEYKKEWENNQNRIKTVLYYSAHLMIHLSKILNKELPYNIKICNNLRILIQWNNQEYDLLNFEPLRQFLIALKLLNTNAFYLGNVGEQLLLPNLKAAMNQTKSNTSECIKSFRL